MELGIRYALTGPDGTRAVFNDDSHPDFVGYLRDVSGLDSPNLTYMPVPLPGQDGAQQADGFYAERPVALEGVIWPDPATEVNRRTELLRRASNALREDAVLTWWPTAQPEQRLIVRRSQPLRVRAGRPREFSLTLTAADPRIQSVEQVVRTVTYAADPTLTLRPANGGEAVAPWTARIQGPITNPTLTHDSGAQIIFTGLTVASGHHLALAQLARTAKYDGTINHYRYVDFAGSEWFGLEPGANTVQLTGTGKTSATALTITYRHTWM